MSAFSRIAMIGFFLLSLSFLVSARPTQNKDLESRDGAVDVLVSLLAKLCVDVQAQVDVILAATVLADVKVAIGALVILIRACVAAIVDLGVIANVDVSVKAEICASVAVVITVIVKACIQLAAKFGIAVVIGLFVELQACIQLLLVKLDICLGAVIALVLKAIVDLDVRVFIKLHLSVLAGVFAAVGL